MYRRRFLTVLDTAALTLLLNATLIAYELPDWLLGGILILLSVSMLYGIWQMPRPFQLLRHSGKLFRRLLADNRAPQLLLSAFLLAFASAQAMIIERGALSALGLFSERFTGDQRLTWLIVGIACLLGMLVVLFRENPLFFYVGIAGVMGYAGLILMEIVTGQISAQGLLVILYLLYGAGGNLMALLAFHYHQMTHRSLEQTRRDLDMAQTLIVQQHRELANLREEITGIRRALHDYST